MKQYIVAYINHRGEIATAVVYATSGSDAIRTFREAQEDKIFAVSLID